MRRGREAPAARHERRRGAEADRPSDTAGNVAVSALRLAALLGAGAVPHAAWRHLADSGDAAAARVADRIAGGAPVAEAIGEEGAPGRRRFGRRAAGERDAAAAWRDVAAAWGVASTVGAPLAESLRGMAHALRDAQETLDDVRVAMAEPVHTARLMSALPFVGVVIAAALGFDVLGVLLAPGAGLICLVVGLALIAGGGVWAAALVRSARPEPGTPGMRAELTAIALGGGVSLERARALVDEAGGRGSETAEVERVLGLSRRAGIPAIDLLRATAEQQRAEARTDGRVRAARLGTRLLLPLGACTLPAFLCLGVVPMLLAVMQTAALPEL
ncbi:type II secretion system F family protein [Microbacterium halophytorum]|uniref:type II secretion system F family protein n=1 Tax=Microbacterium halophytorum TaxID=2067568 RepID=UPI000CFAB5E2|nr:type II secretion system F family protein [Microbacterium halophytorum]